MDLMIVGNYNTSEYDLSTNLPELFAAILKGPEEFHKIFGQFDTDCNPTDGFKNTAILVAAGQGNVETIKYLLDHGANIQDKNAFGKSVLHFASAKGHEEAVKLLLDRGADVRALDTSRNSVLHSAVEGGNIKIVSLFLSLGIHVEQKNSSKVTALHLAARMNNLKIANFLIQNGAVVNKKSFGKKSTLHHACKKGSEKVVRLLLDRGAEVSDEDMYGRNALHFAAESGNENLIKLFFNLKIDVNQKGVKDSTPLHVAAQNGHLKAVELLLDYGANLHLKDKDRKSPLNYACEGGHENVVELLSDRGSLITDDLLQFVAKTNNVKLVEQILEFGINVNTKYGERRSALHFACESGKEKMVKALLVHGALLTDDIVKQAARTGDQKVFEHLVNFGADMYKLDCFGQSLLHYATLAGNESVVHFLLGRGALITEDKCKKTLLHFAAAGENENIVQLFLDFGVAVNARDESKHTALYSAIERSNLSIVKLLLDSGADINAREGNNDSILYSPTHYYYPPRYPVIGAPLRTNNHVGIVKVLLLYGANPQDNVVLSKALSSNNHLIAEKLFDEGVKLDSTNEFITDPYCYKFQINESLQVFLDNQLNVNARGCFRENLVSETLDAHNYSAAKVLTRHVVKMKYQNLYVSDAVWSDILSDGRLKVYQFECEKEMEVLKKEVFFDSTVSYFDVLITRNQQQLVSYARNKDIIEGLKSYDKKKLFPIYAHSLYTQIRNGTWRKLLMEQAADLFVAVTSAKCTDHQLPKLPATFIHELFCCLSNKELKMLTRACKSKFEMDIHDVTKDLIFK